MQFTPDGPRVIDRTQLIEPADANRHVIIRNDSEIRRVSLAAN